MDDNINIENLATWRGKELDNIVEDQVKIRNIFDMSCKDQLNQIDTAIDIVKNSFHAFQVNMELLLEKQSLDRVNSIENEYQQKLNFLSVENQENSLEKNSNKEALKVDREIALKKIIVYLRKAKTQRAFELIMASMIRQDVYFENNTKSIENMRFLLGLLVKRKKIIRVRDKVYMYLPLKT